MIESFRSILRENARGLLLFLVLLICYAYFFPRWADWNQNSRLDLIMAIVDQGTLRIDDYYQNTGDYAYFEGHYYSDKAPGVALLGVAPYAAFKLMMGWHPLQEMLTPATHNQAFSTTLRAGGSGLESQKVYFALAQTFVTCCVVVVPSALLGVVMYGFLSFFVNRELVRVGLVLAYALATPAFAYSGNLLSHQIVAALLFGAFYLLFCLRQRKAPSWVLAPAGAMVGLAVISEYPAALIGLGISAYAIVATPRKPMLLAYALAGAPFGLALAWYNLAVFHTPLPVGYFYSSLFTEQHSTGFLSLTHPTASALWGITFGSDRGLFFLAPWLLLALPGIGGLWRRRALRAELIVVLYTVVAFLVFNASSVMWQGGFAVGPRYILPMVPFMVLLVGVFQRDWATKRLIGATTAVLVTWSVFAVWAETIGGQSFPDWTPNPLFNYSLPRLISGDIARNAGMILGLTGWASLMPLLAVLGAYVTWVIRAYHRDVAKQLVVGSGGIDEMASAHYRRSLSSQARCR